MTISCRVKCLLVVLATLFCLGRVPAQETETPEQKQQREVEELLENLRRLQDLNVAVEVRFITLREDFFERIGLDFDVHADLPSSGLFHTFLHPGIGTRVGGTIPLIGGDTPIGGLWRATASSGFLFNDWGGRQDVQINTPSNNFMVNGAQAYRGELGLGLEILADLEPWYFLFGGEVSGNLGGSHANISPVPFNPSLPVIPLAADPIQDSLIGGWNLRLWTGLQFPNNWQFKVHGGYGDFWTQNIVNSTQRTGTFEVGGSLLIPLFRL